jgi:phosphoglycolate phosphatase-like HAD superfamily hydrolase
MNTQRRILENLNRVHPRLMAVGTLWSEVFMDEETETFTGFKKALRELEEKGQVAVITGEDRHKVKITQDGQARLAE